MRRRILLGLGIGALLLLVVDAIAARLGLSPGAIPKLEGTSLWITSRAAGVTAFLALTLDVLFGLFVSTGAADRTIPRARSVEVHRWLSSVTLSLTGLHVVVLLGDRFVHFDVLDALLPFVSGYRPFAIGIGVLAAYAAAVVHSSFWMRKRLGPRGWRKLHFLSFFAYLAAVLHGVLAGSDTHRPGMQALYLTSASLIALLTLYRVYAARLAALRRAGVASGR